MLAAAFIFALLRPGSALTPAFSGAAGLFSGWSVMAPTSESAITPTWSRLSNGSSIRAALATPGGVLALVSSDDATARSTAGLVLYLNAFGPAPTDGANPLNLTLGLATALPGALAPVATLCAVTQSGVISAASGIACTAGAGDANGWTRVSINGVDSFGASGWSAIVITNAAATPAAAYVTDVTLLTSADVAAAATWADATVPCLRAWGVVRNAACTTPPGAACCAALSAFSAAGCFCVSAVRSAGGAALAAASQKGERCPSPTGQPDDPRCYAVLPSPPPSPFPPPPSPPLPAPPPAPLSPAGARNEALALAAIALVTVSGTAAWFHALRRRVAEMVASGRVSDELLLDALQASLLRAAR